MKNKPTGFIGRLILPLLCILFIIIMLPALLGAGIYGDIAEMAENNFSRRTALSYLSNQLRMADVPGGISIGSFGGSDALILTMEPGYATYIYCHDGQLRELYAAVDTDISPDDGTALLSADKLEIFSENGYLTMKICGSSITIRPRCRGEEKP